LTEDVLELASPVGRVDVDEDDAQLGCRILDEGPFAAVGSPHPDAVAGTKPGREHASSQLVDGPTELGISEAPALVARDQRVGVPARWAPRARGACRAARRLSPARR